MSGYYDQSSSDDDYSSYMDVYATSSSSFKPAVANSVSSQGPQLSLAGNFNDQSSVTRTSGQPNWQEAGPQQQPWDLANSHQQGASLGGNQPIGSGNNFDLATGSMVDSTSANAEKARERNILAAQQLAGNTNKPKVPSSTTTAAPEYVMINPTGLSTTAGTGDSSDQDD